MKPLILSLTFFLPLLAAAQGTYSPMVTLPGVTTGDFDSYINSIYALSISIAALLAVIKIIIAGVKWMTTDVVTTKGEAKKDIQGALLGLIIVLSAVLIITVINPDITDVDFSLSTVSAPGYIPGTPGGLSVTPTNAGPYEYIPTDASNSDIAAFEAGCTGASNILEVEGSRVKCHTLPSGANGFLRIPYSTTPGSSPGQCTRDVTETEDACSERGGTSSVADPDVTVSATGDVTCSNAGDLICYLP